MIKTIHFIFFLMLSFMLTGQEPIEEPTRWEYDSFSYQDFGTGEQHSNFSLLYKLNPNLKAELQGFYDTYRFGDIFDVSFRMRWYPTKKVYVFSGFGTQIEQSKMRPKLPIMPLYMTNGVGLEVNKNIDIEAVYNVNLSNNSGLPSVFKLQGKYRF